MGYWKSDKIKMANAIRRHFMKVMEPMLKVFGPPTYYSEWEEEVVSNGDYLHMKEIITDFKDRDWSRVTWDAANFDTIIREAFALRVPDVWLFANNLRGWCMPTIVLKNKKELNYELAQTAKRAVSDYLHNLDLTWEEWERNPVYQEIDSMCDDYWYDEDEACGLQWGFMSHRTKESRHGCKGCIWTTVVDDPTQWPDSAFDSIRDMFIETRGPNSNIVKELNRTLKSYR